MKANDFAYLTYSVRSQAPANPIAIGTNPNHTDPPADDVLLVERVDCNAQCRNDFRPRSFIVAELPIGPQL